MARSALTVQTISRTGLEPTYGAANADGHSIPNTGREFIHVKNGDASGKTVTIPTPETVDGLAVADRAVSVPAGEERIIGPFPRKPYNQAGSTDVHVDFDDVTSVTVAAIRLP